MNFRRLAKYLGSLLWLASLPAFTAALTNVQSTPQQAILEFDIDNPAQCTVTIYTDAARTQLVNDSDTTIDPNAQACNRNPPGALVNGNHVQFIAGQRTSKKSAADGKLYSLSLQAATHYYFTITNTSDASTFQGEFDTPNIALGSSYPELPPFDRSGTNWANDAYPTVSDDFSKTYIDPVTGLLHRPIPYIRKTINYNGIFQAGIDLSGGKWSNLPNCGANGVAFCTSAGAGASDYLFLPLPHFDSVAGGKFAGWSPLWNVDDLLIPVYCGSTGSPQTIRVWLSKDSGQSAASRSFDVICPVADPTGRPAVTTLPQTDPQGYFANWQPITFNRGDIVPGTGTVTASGTAITLTSGDYFNITTPPGSAFNIGGSYYSVASVQDASHLTLNATGASGAYTGAQFGLRVANITGTNTVAISFGFHHTEVLQNGYGTFNADAQPCNQNGVRDPASGAPAYLCTDQEGGLYLYIPKNANGSWRLEMRPLAEYGVSNANNTHVVGNGDAVTNINANFGGFDATDPYTFYVATPSSPFRIFKVTYTTSYSASCSNLSSYSYGSANGYAGTVNTDCLTWTNLTPANSQPSKELSSQMKLAWATGVNQAGKQVGPPHPEMADIGFLPMQANAFVVVGPVGCITAGYGDNLSAQGCFNLTTGVLQSLVDSWSTFPNRWGGAHAWDVVHADTYGTAINNIIGDTVNHNIPFANFSWTQVIQVNKAGAGSPPAWSNNTALNNTTDFYLCPAITDSKIATYFGNFSGTLNCVQVKINSPLCNHTPAPNAATGGYDFAGGLSERQAFPCSTPGLGVSTSNPDARAWSKLQDIQVGDWLFDPGSNPPSSYNPFAERTVVAQIDYNAANDIDVWLIRGAGNLILHPIQVPEDANGCVDVLNGNHANGFALAAAPSFSCGSSFAVWNVNDPTGTFYPDNPLKSMSHGALGVGTVPDTYSEIFTPNLPNYATLIDKSFSPGGDSKSLLFRQMFSGPIRVPRFGGLVPNYSTQSYSNLTQIQAPAPERRWFIDDRSQNPAYGSGPEIASSCISNPGTLTLALVAGTNQTYRVNDPISGIAPNIKLLPWVSYAGRYNLQDASGPNSSIPDTGFWMCHAYKSGECRSDSIAATIYVSLPHAENSQTCILTDQNSRNTPAVFSASPVSGQITQTDFTGFDPIGLYWRKLGTMWRGPGRQYQFHHAWTMVDGQAVMYRADWTNGTRAGLWLLALPPFPPPDSIARQNLVPVQIDLPAGTPAAPKARVRFGYAENGPAGSFYCTSRSEACSTEGTPFAFISSDSRTLLDCSGGCTIQAPAISGRVLYYRIDRLDSAGNVVESSPLRATAVP